MCVCYDTTRADDTNERNNVFFFFIFFYRVSPPSSRGEARPTEEVLHGPTTPLYIHDEHVEPVTIFLYVLASNTARAFSEARVHALSFLTIHRAARPAVAGIDNG